MTGKGKRILNIGKVDPELVRINPCPYF